MIDCRYAHEECGRTVCWATKDREVCYPRDCKSRTPVECKPKIVTLCGSTRFMEDFLNVARDYTLKGWIVLMPGVFAHSDGTTLTDEQKSQLDELHKRKIDMSDEIFVINKDGYIGSSTESEIRYARAHLKEIVYLEHDKMLKF